MGISLFPHGKARSSRKLPCAPAEEEGQHVERLRPLKDGAGEVLGREFRDLHDVNVDVAVVTEAYEDIIKS